MSETDDERQRFEAWVTGKGGRIRKWESGRYFPDSMQNMWEGWQACASGYLRGYKDGLEHAAFYVHDHCQQGEYHAEVIVNLKRPSPTPLAPAPQGLPNTPTPPLPL